MFRLERVTVGYDGAVVLSGVDLEVGAGELAVVVGDDGTGKTTLARAAAGLLPLVGGGVWWQGRSMRGRPGHQFVRAGISLAASNLLSPRLSVVDNLLVAAGSGGKVRGGAVKERLAHGLAAFPALASRLEQRAGTLSSGQRVMLAIARALCMSPRLLILDEPGIGLAPDTVERVRMAIGGVLAAGGAALLMDTGGERWGGRVVLTLGRGRG